MNFRDLGLTAPILKALTQEGYTDPTPIQLLVFRKCVVLG